MKKRRGITGMGAVTPIGTGTDKYWNNLIHGECGVDHITRFDASNLPVQIAAEVKDFEPKNYISAKLIREMDLFQQLTGKTLDDMKAEMREQAEKRVKFNLILSEIVKAENIEVSDDEVDEEVKEIATYYGREFDEVKKLFDGQLGQIKHDLATRKAVQLIKDNVK